MTPHELRTQLRGNRELFLRIYAEVATSNETSKPPSRWSRLRREKRPLPTFEYQNFIAPQQFYHRTETVVEEVFVCLLADSHGSKVHPYYVSKEYNLNDTQPVKVGRFIFSERQASNSTYRWTEIYLAEEPAKVYREEGNPHFNIELKYLERRQNRSPGKHTCLLRNLLLCQPYNCIHATYD